MTAALDYSLFLEEEIVLNDIKTSTSKTSNSYGQLLEVSFSQNEISEIEVENSKNDNTEIKMLFFENQNPENEISKIENQNIENENSKNESLDLDKVRKDMIKGYMSMLANFN